MSILPRSTGPVSAPTITSVASVAGVSGQRNAGVLRHRSGRRNAGHQLERHPGLRAGGRVGRGGREQEWITAEEPHSELACLGGLQQELRILQLGIGIDQRGAGLEQMTEPLAEPLGRDNQIGTPDKRGGPDGEETLVTRAGAHERDPARHPGVCGVTR
jgi:hypothetical protein